MVILTFRNVENNAAFKSYCSRVAWWRGRCIIYSKRIYFDHARREFFFGENALALRLGTRNITLCFICFAQCRITRVFFVAKVNYRRWIKRRTEVYGGGGGRDEREKKQVKQTLRRYTNTRVTTPESVAVV